MESKFLIKNKFRAFTLAEVLITLGIIGIVAAMTIPSLMNNVQDKQYKTALKKTYSVISNATKQLQYDTGGMLWTVSDPVNPWANADTIAMFNAYSNYLTIANSSDVNSADTASFFAPMYNNYKSSNQIMFIYNCNHNYAKGAVLKDGTTLMFVSLGYISPSAFGMIRLDVNGAKPPNEIGKDFFVLYIYKTLDGNSIVKAPGPTNCIPGNNTIYAQYSEPCTYYALYDLPMP